MVAVIEKSPSRSALPETRNPLLKLESARRIMELPAEPRAALRALLLDLGRDANERASVCWRKHKAPMAMYWKAVAVYSRHIARLLR